VAKRHKAPAAAEIDCWVKENDRIQGSAWDLAIGIVQLQLYHRSNALQKNKETLEGGTVRAKGFR